MPEKIRILNDSPIAIQPSLGMYDIVFGNDRGLWPHDGECDDPRFQNAPDSTSQAMAESPSASNVGNDATDCREYFSKGEIILRPIGDKDGIVFGDNTGKWAFDGECDDPRFEDKLGMENSMSSFLSKMGVKRDATDCRDAYDRGVIMLTRVRNIGELQFGDDTSIWAYDGECDDPRFEEKLGSDAAPSTNSSSDRGGDATDCFRAYRDGKIQLMDR